MKATRARFHPWAWLLLPALVAAAPAADRSTPPGTHVLLITVDTLRYDRVGFLDRRHVRTPSIDALAGDSLVFRRAYAHNPVTLPSHANILTGTTPLHHGISDNTGFKLDGRFPTIARCLKDHGYSTAAFVGAFPLDSRFGLDQGFDLYDDYYGTHGELELFFVERPAQKVVDPALSWIGGRTGKWFAWVHLFDPHQPYLPPSPYRERYPDDPYSGEVAYVDAQLGRLFDFLRTRGLWQKTLIVFTADHGEALGEKGEETHSYFAYNNTIHVPLFVRIPGRAPGVSDVNACHSDIFPTLCAALGLKAPPSLQGESLLDILAAGRRKSPEIYFESLTAHLNRDWAPLRGMISGDTKFIDLPIKEVYDVSKDPGEERNLAASSPIGRLKDALNRLMRRLRNPQAAVRDQRLDPEVRKRLQSLGYLSESGSGRRPRSYGEKDDLKTLLPLQNRMLAGVARYQAGDLPGAEKTLRQVIAESPSFILAYNHLASMFKETGQADRATAVLEEGLKKNPGNIRLMSKLGIVLAESGEWRRALPLLEHCSRQEDFDPENFNFLGIAYYRGERFKEALENYARALELDGNNASVYNNIGSVHLQLFLRNGGSQEFALAEWNFRRALEIDPRMFSALNGLGAVYQRTGRTAEAIACWEKALAIKPDYDLPRVNLGITLMQAGRAAEALEHFLEYRRRFAATMPEKEKQRIERLIAEARSRL
ncbi:MAG: sulfatase-like hydrolase/transferase [Candidatus Aminicenantes bacterium]|nr:sulfatase-like hydrolase/transferase [Candidatus Aminicenantes bacterium]